MKIPSRLGEASASPWSAKIFAPPCLARTAMNQPDGRAIFFYCQTPAYLDKGVRLMLRCAQVFRRGESTGGTSASRFARRRAFSEGLSLSLRFSPDLQRYRKRQGEFSLNLTGVSPIGKIRLNPCLGGVNRLSGMSSRIISHVPVTKQEVVVTAEAATSGCVCILWPRA